MVEPEDTLSPEDLMLAATLEARRPAPTLVFRGTLARRLTRQDPGYGHRPARLWAHAGVLAGAGALFVLLGLLVSTGVI
jgi:hypothetical protein